MVDQMWSSRVEISSDRTGVGARFGLELKIGVARKRLVRCSAGFVDEYVALVGDKVELG